MTSKERVLATWEGRNTDHVPLTTWCFGLLAPDHLRWERNGRPVRYWYSMRMEYLHTFPEPWDLEDDFKRVLAWQSLGIDDLLDVSVPWSMSPEVTFEDSVIAAGGDNPYPIMIREYNTPSGRLRHAVRKTEPEPPGWVMQPDFVPLIEDLNIPRAVEHAVSTVNDVPMIRYLFASPDATARAAFIERMKQVRQFAEDNGVAIQAWSAFGMDMVIWLTGPENGILMSMDEPESFERLVDIIAETDYARTELAVTTPGVDMVVQRGWYSSMDFWSPGLFDRYVVPHLVELVRLAHTHGKKFGYVMTTGVETLGPRLADAGVDVLYFVDPVQDRFSLERARELLADRLTMVGGINTITLCSGDLTRIREEVRRAMDTLGPTQRFILHPVDALFPDTPWEGVEAMIEAWKECIK